MAIPHLFRCPISLDLFTDPVTLSTGQTYDRASIEKWLSLGNLTCPVTMQKLTDPSLVPNHTLRHLITQWLQIHPLLDLDCPDSIDPDRPLAALKHNLESPELTVETKLQTLENIIILLEESPSRKPRFAELGFFPFLLKLLFETPIDTKCQENLQFAEKAFHCVILLLPFGELSCLEMLKEKSKLESFMILLEKGNSIVKKSLCQLLEAISSYSESKELCVILTQTSKFLKGIIDLLQEISPASEAGVKALSALCSIESNRQNWVKEGIVDGLVTYILNGEKSKKNSTMPIAIETLELFLKLESGKEALLDNPNGVTAIVKMVFRLSDHEGSESAVNTLLSLCYESVQVRETAVRAGVLTQLLFLLQSQCSGRTKTKARVLLKLLRSKACGKPHE